MTDCKLYQKRYPFLKYRQGVWREIVRFIQKDVGKADTVIELGTGYCDFINQFPARQKIGYDLNPEMLEFAAKDVTLYIGDAGKIDSLAPGCADLVFASNFMEHLNQAEHEILLPKIYRVLKPGGKLVLIQPNYRLCAAHYFDDETHQSIFSDKDIEKFLKRYGFHIRKLVPGLLPFSMKSKFPKWPILTRLYLLSPVKPFAAQMYAMAERR